MSKYYLEFDIQFITLNIASCISAEELALIESVMPDLILAMMKIDELDND